MNSLDFFCNYFTNHWNNPFQSRPKRDIIPIVDARIKTNISLSGPAKCTTSCADPVKTEYAMKNETRLVLKNFILFILFILFTK